jgi:hypothetical protein
VSVTPETVIVCDATATVPVEDVVKPAALPVVDGALQPLGTVTETAPLLIPPVAAVYVKVRVLPVEAAATVVGDTVIVPEPSAAYVVADAVLVAEVQLVPRTAATE